MPTIQVRGLRDLGAVIKAVRLSSGLRQADLAESMTITRNYLQELEAGKPNLFGNRLFRVLNKLGIRLSVTYELPGDRRDD